MIFVGQASLRRAVVESVEHYHRERNHQGLNNRLIHRPLVETSKDGAVHRHARLGGTLNFVLPRRGMMRPFKNLHRTGVMRSLKIWTSRGLESRLIVPRAINMKDGAVLRHARYGGTLNFYCRKAA
jgi:hypothetical protein